MAETKIIGHGSCPKCGGQTEIKEIQWFPFPEEYQIEEREVCQCGFNREIGFTSSNATTSFDHSVLREIKQTRNKEGGIK